MVVAELGGVAEFEGLAPPRFTSVLNLVRDLNDNNDTEVHRSLRPLLSVERTPTVAIRSLTVWAANSGPLSLRTYSGGPLRMNRSVGHRLRTSCELMTFPRVGRSEA